mgnify:CR=1 FL=1
MVDNLSELLSDLDVLLPNHFRGGAETNSFSQANKVRPVTMPNNNGMLIFITKNFDEEIIMTMIIYYTGNYIFFIIQR